MNISNYDIKNGKGMAGSTVLPILDHMSNYGAEGS